jgi:hypothetical protein
VGKVRGQSVIGLELPSFSVTVERDDVAAFAHAIGETRARFHDIDAARRLGHPDLPIPPTYLFALESRRPQPYKALDVLGVPLSAGLHAEQAFDYDAPVHAGDQLSFAPAIEDYFEKGGGRLGFLRRRTLVRRDGHVVASLRNLLAIRWELVP